MSPEARRAPHADGLRAPPLARSSAGSPCPEQEDARSTEVPRSPGPTEAGWGTGEPRRQGWRRKEAERKGWGEEREGGREGRGRIDSLSSTGTTERSCHGEGEPLAQPKAGGGSICRREGVSENQPPSSPTPGLRAAAARLGPARPSGADGSSRSPGGKRGGAGTSGFAHRAHGLHRPPRGPRGPREGQRRCLPPGRPQDLGMRFPPPPASPALKIRLSKPRVTTSHEIPPHFAASGIRGVHLCVGFGARSH